MIGSRFKMDHVTRRDIVGVSLNVEFCVSGVNMIDLVFAVGMHRILVALLKGHYFEADGISSKFFN